MISIHRLKAELCFSIYCELASTHLKDLSCFLSMFFINFGIGLFFIILTNLVVTAMTTFSLYGSNDATNTSGGNPLTCL